MELAALPGNTAKDSAASLFQAGMGIADDQFDAAQPSGYQTLQKGPPMDFLLAQRDRNAQNLAFTVFIEPHGLEHRSVAYLAILTHFLVVGVKPQVWAAAERSPAPGFQLLI